MAKHKSLPYRPALDGLRGVAVAAVVLFHVRRDLLPGGWLGVDLFFVLSGYLITSLLLAEYHRWGHISLVKFWGSRARRLLPSLVLMLFSVLVASALLAQPGRRTAIGVDVLSAFLYLANWRFLIGDEAYFSQLAMPSPVRHTWSLAIEEQFYFLFPFLLILLLLFVRSRRGLALSLGVLAAASAMWMSHLYRPGIEPTRVYFGTDTRLFELLIGAAAGAYFGAHEFAPKSRWRSDDWLPRLAWPALTVLVAAFVFVDENDGWLFRGGLAALCVVAVVPIVAASNRRRSGFKRALAWEPLRRLGLISYSLYLWHWPVVVFLGPQYIANNWLRPVAQIALSLALAVASYELVEKRVRHGGFRALVPAKPKISLAVSVGTVPVLIAAVLGLTFMPAIAAGQPHRNIEVLPGDYTPLEEQRTFAVIGNSIPESLMTGFSIADYPDLRPLQVTSIGCEPFSAQRVRGGKPQPLSPECTRWREDWSTYLKRDDADLAVLFIPQTLTFDWEKDGTRFNFGTAQWQNWLMGELTTFHTRVKQAGTPHLAVMNLACHRQTDYGFEPNTKFVNDDGRVRQVNQLVARWAKQNGVTVVDQYSALCTGGYHDSINGVPLYKDTLHFTPESAAIMWSWLVPQLQRAMGK